MGLEAGPYLPEHVLIAEVLHRLPVKTLVRFRCVSKTWHHVIASPSLVNAHLTYHKDSSENYILVESLSLCSILTNSDSIFDLRQISKRYITPDQSWDNWRSGRFRRARVYGICNGLLCFSYEDYRIGDDILLWNPTCYKIKKLPEIDTDGVRFTLIASVSFGYYNEDYKVIVIAPIHGTYVVHIYSLSTNSWNSVCPNFHHHIPFDTDDDNKAIFKYTGFVDCTAFMTTRSQLTCFDLSDETFQVIDFPQRFSIRGAEAYGETIAVFGLDWHAYPNRWSFSMWILKDRTSSTSPYWEKKFVLFDRQGATSLHGVGFLNNGKYVARDYTDREGIAKFFVCDFQSEKLLELGSGHGYKFPYLSGARIHSNYVESLLLLNEEGLTNIDCLKKFPYYSYAKKDVISCTRQEQPAASSLDLEEATSEFNLAKVEGNNEAELRQRGVQTIKNMEAKERKVKYAEKRAQKAPQMVSKLMIQNNEKRQNYCACECYAYSALFLILFYLMLVAR